MSHPISFARIVRGKQVVLTMAGSTVQAGFPAPGEDTKERVDIAAYLVRRPESTYFIRVAGDSMTGAGIFDGDMLVVDRSLEPSSGDIVIAVINGEFTVKRFYRNGSGIELRAENPRFKKIPLSEGMEMEIWGVVTSAVKSFRS